MTIRFTATWDAAPADDDANSVRIFVVGGTSAGPDGAGNAEIFNNTLSDCGRAEGVPQDNVDRGALGRGLGSPGLIMLLMNNIAVLTADERHISLSRDMSRIAGSNNLWFGGHNLPSPLVGNVETDPTFVNVASRDCRLQTGSSAISAGVDTGSGFSLDCRFRLQGGA